MHSQKIFTYALLVSVIAVWAIAWPSSKIALQDMPPMWFSLTRLWIGFITIFLILLFQKKIKLPKRQDLPLILTIGLLQMACFLLLLNGGLLFVDAGRSAILVYSTPFLVTPIAILFFEEKLTQRKTIGLVLGLIGILLLFNPFSFDWSNTKIIVGNGLLLLAAVCWAIAMLHTRYGTWHSPSIHLLPWQLLIASLFVMATCYILNPHPQIIWSHRLIVLALYNGLLATGFGYAAIIYVSQRLPVINTSLFLLGVPAIGLISSTLWLGESLSTDKVAALILIFVGLVFISIDKKPEAFPTG